MSHAPFFSTVDSTEAYPTAPVEAQPKLRYLGDSHIAKVFLVIRSALRDVSQYCIFDRYERPRSKFRLATERVVSV